MTTYGKREVNHAGGSVQVKRQCFLDGHVAVFLVQVKRQCFLDGHASSGTLATALKS